MDKLKDNSIVYIDLMTKKVKWEEISSTVRKKYIGGNGINSKILYESEAMYYDSLSEKNVLIFGVGPAVGTSMVAANRCTVTAKSPITDMYGDSNIGGDFPMRMRGVGVDHLVFNGKSEKPVYIFITKDKEVNICDASDIWGTNTEEVTDILKERHGEQCHVSCIGPAGENLVRFASVIMSKSHVAGRTGMGCVMGSKKLKAIVIENTKLSVPLYDKAKLKKISDAWANSCRNSVISKSGSVEGSLMLIKRYEKARCIPIKNFQKDNDERIKDIYPEEFLYKHETKRKACVFCPVGCAREFEISEGKFKGEKGDRIDYGAVAGVGPSVGVFDWPSILHLKMLTDYLGMDTIEIGGALGLILECQQRGILTEEDTGGKTFEFGNADDVELLMNLIAQRKGIGDLLAEGTFRAAKKLNAEEYSFTIKKSSAGLLANSHLAKALSYLTSTRGGDHLKGYVFTSIFGGFFSEIVSKYIFRMEAQKKFADPDKKGRVVWWHENYKYNVDALGFCMFVIQALPSMGHALFKDYADIVNAIYNFDLKPEDMFRAGERIYQLQNAFNINCGQTLEDYKWPTRKKEEDIEDRIVAETTIKLRDHPGMLPEYFQFRGLTPKGKPTVQRFKELGLEEYIEKAEAENIEGIRMIDDLLNEVGLEVTLSKGEIFKSKMISKILCNLIDKKDKRDRKKFLKKAKLNK